MSNQQKTSGDSGRSSGGSSGAGSSGSGSSGRAEGARGGDSAPSPSGSASRSFSGGERPPLTGGSRSGDTARPAPPLTGGSKGGDTARPAQPTDRAGSPATTAKSLDAATRAERGTLNRATDAGRGDRAAAPASKQPEAAAKQAEAARAKQPETASKAEAPTAKQPEAAAKQAEALTPKEEHDRDAAAHRVDDDKTVAQIGTTREKLADYATMNRGDFIGKYGLKEYFTFPKDAALKLPADVLARVLPYQDTTRYLQSSGRVATNADEAGNRAREYTPPQTAAGGVVQGGMLLGGASAESASAAGKLADNAATLAGVAGSMAASRGAASRAPEDPGRGRPTTEQRAPGPSPKGGERGAAGKPPDRSGAPPRTTEKAPATASDGARTIPAGMSRNEMQEPDSKARYHPEARDPVAKQPGVDWVGGKPAEAWTQEGRNVTQTLSGGTWIQGKRLADEAKTSVDARVRGAVDQSCKKFYDPVRNGVSSRSTTMTDGSQSSKLTTTLTNPEALQVHVEVPGFDRMGAGQQTRIQQAAEEQLSRWTDAGGRYEGLPISVQVVDTPPPSR